MVKDGSFKIREDYIDFIADKIKYNKYVIIGMSVIVLIITFLFIFPVIFLFTVHIKNFCQNRTTNERFGGKRYGKPQAPTVTETSS